MYDGYSIFSTLDTIKAYFKCDGEISLKANYLASPTQLLPVLIAGDSPSFQLYHWGITEALAKGKSVSRKLINLPIDQAHERPMYPKLIGSRRCVIPSNGFFLWKQIGKKQKTPYFCHLIDNQLFGIAGIWDEYEDIDGATSYTFNMILTRTNSKLSAFKEERPALLAKESCVSWLQKEIDPTATIGIISHFDENEIELHAVNPKILDSQSNTEDYIKPTLPSDQFGNYTLFS